MNGPITDLPTLVREYAVEGYEWGVHPVLGLYLGRGPICCYLLDTEADARGSEPTVPWRVVVTVGCAHLGVPTPWRAAERLEIEAKSIDACLATGATSVKPKSRRWRRLSVESGMLRDAVRLLRGDK